MIRIFASLLVAMLLISCAEQEAPMAEPSIHEFELDEITISELNEAYDSGKYTAVQVVELYISRIEALNKVGPHLSAIIAVNPDALTIAAALDAERATSGPRSPMHGIPVLLKDNINTSDPMPTTAGSIALIDNYATKDSPLAASLREAGAIIIAKANLSEWANFRSTHSSSGWSGMGGQTRHPYLLTANTSGSSSGSGVAAAANMTAVAIGTETNGSVVSPAASNGVVGIKPTVGLVSRTGIVPIAESHDTAGPMTRTVADGAYLLTAMVSSNPEDPRSLEQPADKINYADHLKADGLAGKRIGVIRSPFNLRDGLAPIFDENVDVMKSFGAIIIDNLEFGDRAAIGKASGLVFRYEFKHYLNAYLAGTPDTVKSRTMADIIAFNRANADKEMPYFKQENFLTSIEKGPLTDPEYLKALEDSITAMQTLINTLMDEHDLDMILLPSKNPAVSQDLINGDRSSGGGTSSYAAISGYPSITVPMGFINVLPVSLSFIGRAYTEAELIEAAYAFEQATKARQKPKFIDYMYE
ncbi:MAG: amidase [Kordiimonadaceae bacterium]|nr:amidase [Kordiimonadaceae bacterium]MBT6035296.1 amidase [Kordiimonadaceae bacterium]MBT6329455.1 amidase [Kordiimonadaceae bacterium]